MSLEINPGGQENAISQHVAPKRPVEKYENLEAQGSRRCALVPKKPVTNKWRSPETGADSSHVKGVLTANLNCP